MRILLLGKNGQLGRALALRLASVGEVMALGRGRLDLGRTGSITPMLDDLRPDLIVNAAAYTAVDQAEEDRDGAFAVNAEAPEILATWAADNDRALIHYSTDYVFDGTKDGPYSEEDPPAPLNVYGESKLAGEEALRASGAAHLILRTSWLYAAEGRNFLTTMLRLGAERQELRVVNDQIGAPTPATWLAEATAAILAGTGGDPVRTFHEKGGLYHASCNGAVSWHGFAEAIFEDARRHGLPCTVRNLEPIPTSNYPLPAKRPANSRLSTARLRATWNIEPPDWRDALDAVMETVGDTGASR